jgi:RNA polymerase sigma-70 factor (ECF subfamily)
MDPTQRASVAEAEHGTDEAFRDTYEREQADLLRYAQAWTRDLVAAEDLCQEAFARLYVAMRSGHEPEIVGAWLRRVVRNLAISRGRRAQVAARHAVELEERDGRDPTAGLVIERERLDAIRVALGRVPEDQRTLLLLAASGYSRAQLGERLGASPGAIRTRLHRARRLLQGELGMVDPVG